MRKKPLAMAPLRLLVAITEVAIIHLGARYAWGYLNSNTYSFTSVDMNFTGANGLDVVVFHIFSIFTQVIGCVILAILFFGIRWVIFGSRSNGESSDEE